MMAPTVLARFSISKFDLDVPLCITDDPDISGIGVRLSMYLQAIFVGEYQLASMSDHMLINSYFPIVVMSYIAYMRGEASGPVFLMCKVQLWTYSGFMAALMVQQHIGRLSCFDAISAYHLAFMSLISAAVGWFLNPSAYFTHPPMGRGYRSVIANVLLGVKGATFMATIFVFIVKSPSRIGGDCISPGGVLQSQDNISWLYLSFKIQGSVTALILPAAAGVVGSMYLMAKKIRYSIQCLFALYLSYYILEVISVEQSLLFNQGVGDRNTWTFGQVRTKKNPPV